MTQEDVQARLAGIWRRVLGRSDVTPDSAWFAFRPGSKAPLLFEAIRRELGVDLPEPVLYRDNRLRDLAATVRTGAAPAGIDRVVELRAGRRPPCLVYVPGAFGEDLHALDDLTALDHPVYFLRAPGLDAAGTPLASVPELAEHHLDGLLPVLGDRPAVLAGFSLGAMVALEMAHRGVARGWRPLSVVLIDMLPPLSGEGADELDENDLVMFRLQRIVDRLAEPGGEPAPACFGADLTPELVEEVTTYLHRRGSPELPAGVGWPHLERRLRVYAAGTRAGNAHTVRPCEVPVAYLRTAEGREQGLTWAGTSRCGPPEIIDVERTHSTLWDGGAAAEALGRLLAALRPLPEPAAALLFDLDGVLLDSTALVLDHWRRFASWYGLPTERVLRDVHGRRASDLITALLADRPAEVPGAIRQHDRLEREDVAGVVALPGAKEVLAALPGHRWAVVTAGTSEVARRRMRAAGLPEPAVLVGAEQVAAGKPAPDGYLAAARRLGVDAARCVVLEDAPHGVAAGRAAGAYVLALATTHDHRELTAADRTVPDLTALRVSVGTGGVSVSVRCGDR